jgi:ElaB/YqjD/DUF883 family membrane-anchored ribosome-binding protein
MTSTSTDAREKSKEVASTAVDEARDVGRVAQDAAQTVAQDVRDEVGQVAGELRGQARNMVDETRTQLRERADAQTAGVANGLGRFADELRALANGHPDQAATARRYLDQAGSAIGDVAGQLRSKDFEGVVRDVQSFARRRPGTFLAVSAAVGFMAGRLVRSASDDADSPAALADGRADLSGTGVAGLPDATDPSRPSDPGGNVSPGGAISGVGSTTGAAGEGS